MVDSLLVTMWDGTYAYLKIRWHIQKAEWTYSNSIRYKPQSKYHKRDAEFQGGCIRLARDYILESMNSVNMKVLGGVRVPWVQPSVEYPSLTVRHLASHGTSFGVGSLIFVWLAWEPTSFVGTTALMKILCLHKQQYRGIFTARSDKAITGSNPLYADMCIRHWCWDAAFQCQ